jgi:NAD(P)-dependent dehydrogenase (short-subunit alcohol dehydrogenase family)
MDARDVPRAALVTGAARRIGRAIASDLGAHGWDVAIHHHTATAEARRLVREIEAHGRRAVALRADLADEAAAAGLLPRACERLGPISLLVNNAAIFEHDLPRVLNLTPHYTSYTVSKAGLWALTRHLALALAPRVRVNAIGPGIVLPPPGTDEDSMAAMRATMPLRRSAGVDEICACVRFIVTTPSLTGQMIVLDGGQHLGWLQPQQTARQRDRRAKG